MTPHRDAARVALLYGVAAALWIALSEALLTTQRSGALFHLLSGFLFVLISGLIVYQLIARRLRVTGRLRDELHASEARLRRLLETLPHGVEECDTEGLITYGNPAYHHILGYQAGELVGRRIWDQLAEPAEREFLRTYLDELVTHEPPPTPYVSVNARRDGSLVRMQVDWDYQHDANGRLTGFIAVVTDVTESFEAREALAESETRFRQLAESIDAVFILSDRSGREILYVSPAYERIWGRSRESLIREPRSSLRAIHPEDRRRAMAALGRWTQGEPVAVEYRIRTPGGEVKHIRTRSFPIRDSHGEIVRLAGIAEDVTARWQEARERERLLAFQATLLDTLPVPVFYKDRSGCYLGGNRLVAETLGLPSVAALTGKRLGEVVGPEDAAYFQTGDEDLLAHPGRQIYQTVLRVANRPPRDVVLTKATFPDETGRPGGIIGVIQDITEERRAMRALSEREERIRLLLDSTGEGIYAVDRQGVCTIANPAAARLLGYDHPDDLLGKSIHELIHHTRPDGSPYPASECRALAACRDGRGVTVADEVFWRRDGSSFPAEYRAWPILRGGRPAGAVVTFDDISERRRSEERLRQAVTVFDNTLEGVMITDRDNRIIAVNRAFTAISGYTEEEALGQTPALLESQRHDRSHFDAMWRSIRETGTWRGEIWNRRKSGEIHPAWLTISTVRDDGGAVSHYVGVFSDISDIKQSQARLDHLVHYDPLTNLPNRLLFTARVEHALQRSHRERCCIAVLFLDLDGFKTVNEGLGYRTGDRILEAVAERLRKTVREEDTVARLTGDEFALLLESLHQPDDAQRVAETILAAFREPLKLEGHTVYLTASVGISLFPRDGTDAAALLRNADTAMSRAKEQGRDGYQHYTDELSVRALQRLRMESQLRQALERNQFTLHYQPLVALESGAVVGCEALLRWVHPDLGSVSPDVFVPLAEQTGLIVPIGAWVLESACTQAQRWRRDGLAPLRVSVNVSGLQFDRGDLVGTVARALERSGIDPTLLELEITESDIMRHTAHALQTLDGLRGLGVTLAIDDFGTGYSSLAHLKRLPVHTLKIDRGFVTDLPADADDAAITRAVIALARTMHLQVVAEGVETPEQAAFLRSEGCDVGQGYLFSQPLAPAALEAWMRAREPASAV